MSAKHTIRRELKHAAADDTQRVLERLERTCRVRGQRVTRQRRAVLQVLLAEGGALTAYELLDRLRRSGGRSTPAAVYRALEFWMDSGLVHRMDSTRSFVLCEHPEGPHPGQLLICRQCGTVIEAEDKAVSEAASRLGSRLNFTLDVGLLELTGVCALCCARGRRTQPAS
jgi:Fur family zinc uptake transcriptional regulator